MRRSIQEHSGAQRYPSEQLIPAMQFMASSLGVECSFCHVEGHFDKDDKKTQDRRPAK